MEKLGYRAPFVLMTVLGVFFIAHYYIPHPLVQKPGAVLLQWKQPLGAVMMLVASLSLLWIHAKRVMRRERRYGYSLVTLLSAFGMVFVGMAFGLREGTLFSDWFEHLVLPLESTMFSLLAFFVASAAFRAFTAAKRAILIGVALGFISVAVKTIVGIDKTILRKGR
jgi:hypothetical protein